jgi:hypothetical protein
MPIRNYGQLYFTKNGEVSFLSKTILENINADNNQVISVINFPSGEIQFSLLNNAFHFPKAKMEQDFNEDYMESEKFPRSTFKGAIAEVNKINLEAGGSWKVMVKGDLQIHGVTKTITIPATITVKNGAVTGLALFKVAVADYNIKVPSLVSKKIAENVEVKVSCNYQKK